MSDHITLEDAYKALEHLWNNDVPRSELRFFTRGTGIPDRMAIDYWKDTNIIVVDREMRQWQHGKLLEDTKATRMNP